MLASDLPKADMAAIEEQIKDNKNQLEVVVEMMKQQKLVMDQMKAKINGVEEERKAMKEKLAEVNDELKKSHALNEELQDKLRRIVSENKDEMKRLIEEKNAEIRQLFEKHENEITYLTDTHKKEMDELKKENEDLKQLVDTRGNKRGSAKKKDMKQLDTLENERGLAKSKICDALAVGGCFVAATFGLIGFLAGAVVAGKVCLAITGASILTTLTATLIGANAGDTNKIKTA